MSGLTLELAAGITKLRLAAAEDRAFYRWARLYARQADPSSTRTGPPACSTR